MEAYVAGLAIEDEEEELVFEEILNAPQIADYSLCLVGFLVTDKRFNFPVFRNRMASLWRPGCGVTIKDIRNKLIFFRFYHRVDLKRVMDLGPWSFNQSLLVLKEIRNGEEPTDVGLFSADFWVQIYDLPVGFFSATVGRALGDYIGTFVSYDEKNTYSFVDSFMRIRVSLDIQQLLKIGKKLHKAGGEATQCKFRYERLPNFCYICGKIGHIDRFCEVLFHVPEEDIVRQWSKELRAPPKSQNTMEVARWLVQRKEGVDAKEEKGEGGNGLDMEAGIPRCLVELLSNLGVSMVW